MSRVLGLFLLLVAPFPSALGQGGGSGFSAYLTLSNDLPHRGISQTDEDAALQIGLDYQHRSGFFLGGWISNVDFRAETSRTKPREIELDYYLGYNWAGRDWSFTGTLARYTYPDTSVTYDYDEISANFRFRERFFYTVSYTDALFSHDNSAFGHELGVEWPLPWDTQFSASMGRFDSDDIPAGAFDHWNAGLSRRLGRFGLDLRYYDTDYDRISPLGTPLTESWVVSVSYRL